MTAPPPPEPRVSLPPGRLYGDPRDKLGTEPEYMALASDAVIVFGLVALSGAIVGAALVGLLWWLT